MVVYDGEDLWCSYFYIADGKKTMAFAIYIHPRRYCVGKLDISSQKDLDGLVEDLARDFEPMRSMGTALGNYAGCWTSFAYPMA